MKNKDNGAFATMREGSTQLGLTKREYCMIKILCAIITEQGRPTYPQCVAKAADVTDLLMGRFED